MSTFGRLFRVTTFGESHCKSVGCVIDGCPPRLLLTESDIQPQLTRRRPGQSKITTPRDEADEVIILSGTEGGYTLGTPISLIVNNLNIKPGDYKEMSEIPRPGHADFTYQGKYGIRASSGGGRASARETIGRVAAGAVAEKWLREKFGTEIVCFVSSVGEIELPNSPEFVEKFNAMKISRDEVDSLGTLRIIRNVQSGWKKVEDSGEQKKLDEVDEQFFADNFKTYSVETPCYADIEGFIYNASGEIINAAFSEEEFKLTNDVIPTRCPHIPTACKIITLIRQIKLAKDSIGGTVTCIARNVPIGLGEPVFDKLEAELAHAMLSLPATKGFEIGSGFAGTKLRGSVHNDPFEGYDNADFKLRPKKNDAGGTLGGISSGADIRFRVAVKSVSTIGQEQHTTGFDGKECVLEAKGRHDPCVLPRVPPLVEGMTALVLADATLIQLSRVAASSSQLKASTIADQVDLGYVANRRDGL